MKLLNIIIAAAIAAIAFIIIRKRCGCGSKEKYGGNQTKCETACFSSPYYDACMNSCMQDGRADYIESEDEYTVLGMQQVDDLDRGYGYDTPQSY